MLGRKSRSGNFKTKESRAGLVRVPSMRPMLIYSLPMWPDPAKGLLILLKSNTQCLLQLLKYLLSDPYARVAFANQSQVTYTITQSPCPTWDQTLLFTSVDICEDPENVKRNPPSVVVELYDHDTGLVRQNCRTERISRFSTKDRKKPKTKKCKNNTHFFSHTHNERHKKGKGKTTHDYLLIDSHWTCRRILTETSMQTFEHVGEWKVTRP